MIIFSAQQKLWFPKERPHRSGFYNGHHVGEVRNANLPNMRNTIDRYKHIDKDNLEFRFAKAIRLIWHKTQRARL